MKCVKCGAELKEGCIYCSVCGNEAQMVEDYSVLEDDYLRTLLKEEEVDVPKSTAKPPKKKKIDSRIPIIVVCVILFLAILLGIGVKALIEQRNANSYDYQMEAAREECIDKNYENALHYYKTALSLRPSDVPVRLAMADIYKEQAEYDAAEVLLMEAIDIEPTNEDAYKALILVYETQEDYKSIAALASDVNDADVRKLFEGYIVSTPVTSPIGGEYDEYIDVILYPNGDYDIYYTLDGSEPSAENGTLYDEEGDGIPLDEEGKHRIKAVCINDNGICSEIAEATYEIEFVAPEYATVTPDGGRIVSETTVTIEAEEDCSIYYTWDGTDPTEASSLYTEPLEIPAGNKVLSVLVINNETGLDSGVYRTNFIYYP